MNKLLNIIHLDDRPDRLTQLANELEIQSLKACLWPGIRESVDPRLNISLAHNQIIRYAKEQGLRSIIIAEDDIKFTAPGAFDFYLQQKPDDYDLYLGGILYGDIQANNIVLNFVGTYLYTIHERFYDRFLSIQGPGDIDRLLAGKGKFVVCNPFAAIVHNGFSDNKGRYMNYDCYTESRKLFGTDIFSY
jgi:hypothetical protein